MVYKFSFVLGALALFSAPDGLLDPELPPEQVPETIPDPVMNMGDVEDVLSSFLATLAPLCIVFLVVRLVHSILLELENAKKELEKSKAEVAALEAELKKSNYFSAFVLGFVDQRSQGN